MSGLVVDASVGVAALTERTELGDWSRQVVESHELVAPHLFVVEVTNVLRRAEVAGRVSADAARTALRSLLHLRIELFDFAPVALRVWELRTNVTAYDAWYVAIAESLRVPMATLDVRLIASTGPRCQFLDRP